MLPRYAKTNAAAMQRKALAFECGNLKVLATSDLISYMTLLRQGLSVRFEARDG